MDNPNLTPDQIKDRDPGYIPDGSETLFGTKNGVGKGFSLSKALENSEVSDDVNFVAIFEAEL